MLRPTLACMTLVSLYVFHSDAVSTPGLAREIYKLNKVAKNQNVDLPAIFKKTSVSYALLKKEFKKIVEEKEKFLKSPCCYCAPETPFNLGNYSAQISLEHSAGTHVLHITYVLGQKSFTQKVASKRTCSCHTTAHDPVSA